MENDFIKRLEERAAFKDPWDDWELAQESLDHIRKLEAALTDALQYVSRANWYYLKPETRKALEGEDD